MSGHIRGSIHSMHAATPELMRLHRGQPVLFVNDRVAAERGIADGERVRLFNDQDDEVISFWALSPRIYAAYDLTGDGTDEAGRRVGVAGSSHSR